MEPLLHSQAESCTAEKWIGPMQKKGAKNERPTLGRHRAISLCE